MKDGLGQPLHEGNLVQVMIGQQPVRGYILKMKDGGLTLALAEKTQQPQGVTPDILTIQMDILLTDNQPGIPHPTVVRLCDPSREVIVPIKVKEAN